MRDGSRRGDANRDRATRDGDALWDVIRRAFAEFLAVPALIIVGFILLAAGVYLLDFVRIGWLGPLRDALQSRLFARSETTADLLSTIAGSLFTVTSITISLLLLALQQAASALTHQVFDQFLRRRGNQVFFGYFIGLTLYALLTLSTVSEVFNPVFGATLALVLTVLALLLLLVLLYSIIDQMRPAEIVDTIHGLILAARERQLTLLSKTRRRSESTAPLIHAVHADRHGYVTHIDVDAIARGMNDEQPETEVALAVSIGSFLAIGDVLAQVKAKAMEEAQALEHELRCAIRLERRRDVDGDPAFGIVQLWMIAWTSVSTAKSNPDPGLLIIRSLRDIMARWSDNKETERADPVLPIVYRDDVIDRLMDTLESMAVVASESMQHQTCTELVRALAMMLGRLPREQQDRVEDILMRSLSALGEHVLTADLDNALTEAARALEAAGRPRAAMAMGVAQGKLRDSVGRLNSRSTRTGTA